jgi:acetyl esterase/lipase
VRVASAQPAVTVLRDVPYGGEGGARSLDAFLPQGEGPFPAVVFVHGGAWSGGDKEGLAAPANQAALNGWVGVTINYRLAPPRWPTQLEDVRAAIRFLRASAERFRIDPSAIALVGASSGANLALLAGMAGDGALTEGDRVRAVVSWSGPTDLEALVAGSGDAPGSCSPATCARRATTRQVVEAYLGCGADACPEIYREASPISHVDASDPPVLLINGTDELIPLEQATAMAEALREAGVPVELVEVPGSRHGTEFGRDVWPQTLAFLERWLFELPRGAAGEGGEVVSSWPAAAVVVLAAALGILARRRARAPAASP